MLTFGHLHDWVVGAVLSHFAEDPTMAMANERARAARLLVHCDRHRAVCNVCHPLHVDSEYSRVGGGFTGKYVYGRRAFPDLLIHLRTVQEANVLAAEVKLREGSRPRAGPDEKDEAKILAMTGRIDGLPGGMEPYSVGLCLNLSGNSAEGWWTVPLLSLVSQPERFGEVSPWPQKVLDHVICEL